MQVKTLFLPFSLIFFTLSLSATHRTVLSLNQEGLYLQQAKLTLSDTTGSLSDWSEHDANPCNWTGITCSTDNYVVSLVLSGLSLSGSFPEFLCRLHSLSKLSLSNNFITSALPLSISSCRNLTFLDLSYNLFVGPIPSSLADLHFLRYLNLGSNNFSGEIPASFGRFRQLENLELTYNLLSGTIPGSLGNIKILKKLALAYNPFSPGQLAPELGKLTNLEELWLTECHLFGPVPETLGRLSRLKNFDLAYNRLTGPIPSFIFLLNRIVQIELYGNKFTGKLPEKGWSSLTELRRFDASMNELTGTIPDELCELPLESLNLFENQLEGSIPVGISKSPNLYELKLFRNRLTGSLPSDLGKNSLLQILDVSNCDLSGLIPESLCRNRALEQLVLFNNWFSGNIPADLGKCQSLMRVRMSGNRFSGEIPDEFWGLPRVYLLELFDNAFSGNISHLINGAKNLSKLVLSKNKFSGILPNEIGSLGSLIQLLADQNELTGEIPATIVNLSQLGRLDLSYNELSGSIPAGVQSLKELNGLILAGNQFSGRIPDELGNLPILNDLDLSQNGFFGEIPLSLQNLKLNKLNLSDNQLIGDIPPLFAKPMYSQSFLKNPGLCVNGSGSCDRRNRMKNVVFSWILWSILVITGIACLVCMVWFVKNFKKLGKAKRGGGNISKWTSFHNLGFNEFEIADSIKESNLIGKGASGKVYKVVLSDGEIVAVKKLGETTSSYKDEFKVEVEVLGKIRHKNIVKLWCCCTMGKCKLLVYEYMPNGSLGELLHSEKSRLLDWPMRFKIGLDAAEGLLYLHHDCVPPIVHRDVKSNNILLDGEFRAKISDFGIAKVVKGLNAGNDLMSGIAGSCGYIAPEYAYTLRVNEKSDIYSFGIVLLELVTGKPPIHPHFGGKDLASWVYTTLDQNGADHVLDPQLDSRFKQHMYSVLEIGLHCTSSLPGNRPSMRRVVKMMQELDATMPGKDPKTVPPFVKMGTEVGGAEEILV